MSVVTTRPLIVFLLIASFGILFAGCGSSETEPEDVVFTQEELEQARELARRSAEDASGAAIGVQPLSQTGAALPSSAPVVDLTMVPTYNAIRTSMSTGQGNLYRVTFEFVNIRSEPKSTASTLGRRVRGESFDVLEFVDAAWAKVRLEGDKVGYVSAQYLARVVPEERFAEEKKKFEGLLFVDFAFVNVRAAPDQKSEKLGELPANALVRPLSQEGTWVKVAFSGRDGYVSTQYLSPFLPTILVRQESFTVPVLHYRLSQQDALDALGRHIATLTQNGMKIVTLREFAEMLLTQEKRDVRIDPKTVVLTVADVTPDNVVAVSDALRRGNIRATIFLQTRHLGLQGITEKTLLSLVASGHDLQSAGHTGDDLRPLTNEQVQLELTQSRKMIEEVTKKPVLAVLYPLGGTNDRVMQLAAQAGYLFGVTNASGRTFPREGLLRMPSITVAPQQTGEEVLAAVKGG